MTESAWQTAAGIRSGELSAVDVVSGSLARIGEDHASINAFTVVTADSALARAEEVDRGERVGPLAGVPISIKDHVWVRGLPATNGSRALADFIADADCACVSRLVQAGAVIVGKTNNPEFCYRGVTANELWGETRNPRNQTRTMVFFESFDVLLTPTMPVTAFELGRLAPATVNGRQVPDSFDAWCALALPANLCGIPAASVPIGTGRDGLPVGLQVMGARWADATVLRAAAATARDVEPSSSPQ